VLLRGLAAGGYQRLGRWRGVLDVRANVFWNNIWKVFSRYIWNGIFAQRLGRWRDALDVGAALPALVLVAAGLWRWESHFVAVLLVFCAVDAAMYFVAEFFAHGTGLPAFKLPILGAMCVHGTWNVNVEHVGVCVQLPPSTAARTLWRSTSPTA
jgi:hypothetical protein